MSHIHMSMRSLTENFAHGHLITDNILQEARDDANDNVLYSKAIHNAIIAMGHSCELIFSERCDVIRQLRAMVVREELK